MDERVRQGCLVDQGLEAQRKTHGLTEVLVQKAHLIRNLSGLLGITLLYLPAYCPESAPVEIYFALMKRHTAKASKRSMIDFSKEEGARVILGALVSCGAGDAISCWYHLIKLISGRGIGAMRQ